MIMHQGYPCTSCEHYSPDEEEYIESHKKEKSCTTCLYCRDGICKDEACVGCYDDPNHSNYKERDI